MIRLKSWQPTANFGDMLSSLIVESLSGQQAEVVRLNDRRGALVALGSIGQYAYTQDVVWGTGIRQPQKTTNQTPTIHAVRGPLSAKWFRWSGDVFGDPAIILPVILPLQPNPQHDYGYIRHASERLLDNDCLVIDVNNPDPLAVLRDILSCRVLITSALHPLIVADAYGVPVIPIRHATNSEQRFKYRDYFATTGRPYRPAVVTDSIDPKDLAQYQIKPHWSRAAAERLRDCFPYPK